MDDIPTCNGVNYTWEPKKFSKQIYATSSTEESFSPTVAFAPHRVHLSVTVAERPFAFVNVRLWQGSYKGGFKHHLLGYFSVSLLGWSSRRKYREPP